MTREPVVAVDDATTEDDQDWCWVPLYPDTADLVRFTAADRERMYRSTHPVDPGPAIASGRV